MSWLKKPYLSDYSMPYFYQILDTSVAFSFFTKMIAFVHIVKIFTV